MESSSAAPTPAARGRALPFDLGTLAWLVLAAMAAAGAGLLTVADERLAVDIALVAVAAVALYRYPLPALVLLLLVVPRKSPFVALLFLVAAAIVVLWRLPFVPGRSALLPLALLLLFALPGVDWNSGFYAGSDSAELIMPLTGFDYLDTPSAEGFEWMMLGFVLVAALVAAWQCTTITRFRVLVGATLLAALFPLASGLQQLVEGEFVSKGDFSAVRGSFDFPNEFGIYLVLILLLAVVAAFELRERWAKLGACVLLAVGTLMLFHSYTRSAWIGFAAALMLLAVIRYRALIAVALLALVIAIVGFPTAVDSVQARFGDLGAQNAANSSNSWSWRRGQWEAMWHYGSEKPLTGQGFGSYRRKTLEEFGLQGNTYATVNDAEQTGRVTLGFAAHNDYVKHWVETGATGLVLWCLTLIGLLVVQLRALRVRQLSPWAAALLACTVAFIGISASDNVQGYTVPTLYLVVLTAALAAVAHHSRRVTEEPAAP